MFKIGIVVAMPEEAREVLNWLGTPETVETRAGFLIKIFKKNQLEIYFIISGVGEISAGLAAQTLICRYEVEGLINFGLCGSLTNHKLGEMCYAICAVHYDFDISKLNNTIAGEYPDYGIRLQPKNDFVKMLTVIEPSIKGCCCASSDKFVTDDVIKANLNKHYDAEICEMESAAIYISALKSDIPAIAIKIISDAKHHAEEFNNFLARKNFDFISILDKLFTKITEKS